MVRMRFCARAMPVVCTLVLFTAVARSGFAQSKGATPSNEARVELMLDEIVNKLVVAYDAHWHKGEYNHNINIAKMIIAARPDFVDFYANSGWLLWSMNRDDEAVALYEKGIKANPNTYYMYDELAQYYFIRKKDYATAAKHYERAVKFKDAKPQSWNALARCYEKTGQLEKALAAWEKAVTYKDNPAAKPNLDRVRNKLKQGITL